MPVKKILPSKTFDLIDKKYFLSINTNLADKFFCIIESSICVPKDLGSKATETPVPKIPFEETPTHPEKNNDVTVTVAKHRMQIPYGVIKFDDSQNFIAVEEKPDIFNYVLSGIYCLNKEIANSVENKKTDMPNIIERSHKKGKKVGNDGWRFSKLKQLRVFMDGEKTTWRISADKMAISIKRGKDKAKIYFLEK